MYGDTKHDLQCAEFESLMAEALDGLLAPDKLSAFQAHAAVCPDCGVMLAEAESGLRWLNTLEEVAPPANLVHNIMVATVGTQSAAAVAVPASGWKQALRGWFSPVFATVRQPRFAMSFGMAFFSISLLLNAVGIKLADVRYLDLRPNTVVRKAYEAKGRVVSYYENIRFVYELETRVRELKRATTPEEPAPQQQSPKAPKDNTSGEPEREKYRNYSREEMQPTLAQYRTNELNAATARREL